MTYIAGVDIGNSTTEVCIGEVGGAQVHFLSSASCKTTGTKGTIANVHGIRAALKEAMGKIGMETEALSLIRLNEAAPVIGDTAMETLTETIITDSSMIGHNPSTPAGAGQAVGKTLDFERIREGVPGTPYIVFAKAAASYEEIAEVINRERKRLTITGVILQADEAVLVENRLEEKVPIIDEVAGIQKLPDDVLAAIEVALPGQTIRMLSNPYGIATLLGLDAEQTRMITPIAKSLIGKRSAVVLKTPGGNIRENLLPAGKICLHLLFRELLLPAEILRPAHRTPQTRSLHALFPEAPLLLPFRPLRRRSPRLSLDLLLFSVHILLHDRSSGFSYR